MAGCFALCMDLHEKTVLLAGDGPLAREKLDVLLPFGARLRLFDFDPHGTEYASCGQLEYVGRPLQESDLDGPAAFVVVCGAPRAEQERISALCQRRNVPVNVVDVPELCTFYFPSLVTSGALTIAVSSAGKSPSAAIWLKQKIAALIPSRTAEILDWAAALRPRLRETDPDWRRTLRRAVFDALEQNRVPDESAGKD